MANLKQEKTTYIWKSQLPDSDNEWLKLEEKDIQIGGSRKITIWLKTRCICIPKDSHMQKLYVLQALIRKTDHQPTSALISLQLSESKTSTSTFSTKIVRDWAESCSLKCIVVSAGSYSEIDKITCEITWPASFLTPKPSNLHDKMANFVMSSSLSDVTIVIGEKELPAHKLILCSWSEVFLKMLTSPMKEARENRIVIDDVEFDIMKMVLRFMYTGDETNFDQVDVALKILTVAEKYEINKLKEICEHNLCENLTVHNVLKILNEADNHRACRLKNRCFNFIFVERNSITGTNCFQNLYLAKPELVDEFMTSVSSRLVCLASLVLIVALNSLCKNSKKEESKLTQFTRQCARVLFSFFK